MRHPAPPAATNQLKLAIGTISGLTLIGALTTTRFTINLTAQLIAWGIGDDAEKNWTPTLVAFALIALTAYKLLARSFAESAAPHLPTAHSGKRVRFLSPVTQRPESTQPTSTDDILNQACDELDRDNKLLDSALSELNNPPAPGSKP